ncbi:MAG: hypothetical protein VX913_13395 [Planctomycetota bacterium]|nr:hypothetical protein [Planctomycetota bacterium]
MKSHHINSCHDGHTLARVAVLPLWLAGFMAYVQLKEPGAANEFVAGVIIVLAAAMVGWGARRLRRRGGGSPRSALHFPSVSSLAVGAVTAAGAWAWAPDLRPAAIIALGGVFLSVLARFMGRPGWGSGILSVSWLGVAAAVSYAAYFAIEPWVQYVELPTFLSRWLGELFGFTAYVHGDALVFEEAGRTAALGAGPRYGEVFPVLLALVLGSTVILQGRGRGVLKRLVVFGCLTEVCRQVVVMVKVVMLLSDSVAVQRPGLAIAGWAAGYLPLLLLAVRMSRSGSVPGPTEPAAPAARRRLAVAGIAVGCVLISVAMTWTPPGEVKGGRVAVDAVHSRWEWTDVPLNRTLFGTKTTYNFWSMMVYLRQFFPAVDAVSEGPLTAEVINDYDVWILKTPTSPYSDEEVAAFHEFVEGGGGLFLIGDHTNIFGMNAFLNQVGSPMGITFMPDATFDMPEKEDAQLWVAPTHRAHPTVSLMDEFVFATSDTLTLDSVTATPIMVGGPYYADGADYSKLTFFGDHQWSTREPSGQFIQAAAATYGDGRVVAFGDSTVFSSFFMHTYGKSELALGSVNWLNHRNRLRHWPAIPMALGGALALAGLALGLTGRRPMDLVALVPPAAVGVVIGLGLADLASRELVEELPEPNWTRPRVSAMCGDPRALRLRRPMGHDETDPHVFMNYYVGFQRADTIPSTVRTVKELLESRLSLMVEPTVEQAERMSPHLPSYLDGGGRLWVLSEDQRVLAALHASLRAPELGTESISVAPRTWPELQDADAGADGGGLAIPAERIPDGLKGLPMRVVAACLQSGCQDATCVHRAPLPVVATNRVSGLEMEVTPPTLGLLGYEPLLVTEGGRCVHGRYTRGLGQLIVTSNPAMFSERELGTTTDIPTRERYALFEMMWQTVDAALGREVDAGSLIAKAEAASSPERR